MTATSDAAAPARGIEQHEDTLTSTAGSDVEKHEDGPMHHGNKGGPSDDEDHNDLDLARKTTSIAEQMSPAREFFFVATIICVQLMTQASLAGTLAILHVIGDHYGLDNPGELSWLIAGYSLTVGTFILVSGRFGDVFGYKRMVIIGYAWFSVFSMVAGLAVYSNHVLFVFARVLQGIGPSICLPNGLAILGATYPPGKKKAMMFALFGAVAPNGALIGSTFAGLFNLVWWPWTYWAFAIALAGLAIFGSFVIPDPPRQEKRHPTDVKGWIELLDIPGGVIGVTALVLINLAWNQAGVVTWREPYVYVCLILGMLLLPVFFVIERRASNPLIPFQALTSDVAFVLACVACGWSCFGIWVYYLWQILEELRGISPLLATAYFSPVGPSGALAAIVTGILLGRIRPGWVMMMAMTAFIIGATLIATVPPDQIYWGQFFVCSVVIPWGMDMSFPAATLILSNAVEKEHQGIAASLVNTVVNYSISLSLGFAGTIDMNINRGGKTPEDILYGYRGGLWFGAALAMLGLVISLLFLFKSYTRDSKDPDDGKEDTAST